MRAADGGRIKPEVLRSRKLRVTAAAIGSCLALVGLSALPTASAAATCTVIVELPDGTTTALPLTVNHPTSELRLPNGQPLPAGTRVLSEKCPDPTTTTTGTTPTTPTSATTQTTTPTTPSTTTQQQTTPTTTKPNRPPRPHGPGKSQRPSKHSAPGKVGGKGSGHHKAHKPQKPHKKKPKAKPKAKSPSTAHKGAHHVASVPTSTATTSAPPSSFLLPGPAPIGVPNFFIDSFRIPPFLLPIYQAAGIQYDVPWQVLAAVNEIETDYGRNLSVSTAGAVGWMQFLPSTWKEWGVDANGDGVADPYNPVDAIFSAARYLHAAGASKNLSQAIFAYNHANWYVQSVLLRAKLIGGMPGQLVGALTGLVEGHFPVAAPSKYADDQVEQLAKRHVRSANAAIAIDSDPTARGVAIYAKRGSPVIAVNDGKVVKMGRSAQLGRYLELQDATGNVYTYANLGSIPKEYPVPKPVKVTAAEIAKQLAEQVSTRPAPKSPATAGSQQSSQTPATAAPTNTGKRARPVSSKTEASVPSSAPDSGTIATPLVKERLFANPHRPASYAAGGALQIKNTATTTRATGISKFRDFFSDVLHLARDQYTLQPLRPGAVVVGGTILGRIGKGTGTGNAASHLEFMVRPAGKNAPQIDPKPILDGWKLLEATAVYRASGVDPFFGPGSKNATVGQVLLMSKEQLESRVLADPHVQIYSCGRRDIEAGLIDRRILGVIEFLSASGLDPTVSGLDCGHSLSAATGVDAAGASGSSMDISKINGIPIAHHQGSDSITDIAIRRLLTLQGAMRPDEIVSMMSYKGQSNTLTLPDHTDRIQVAFTPLFGRNNKVSAEVKTILQPGQWIKLINHLSQIPEPIVSIAPSKYAIKTKDNGQ
jgi:hypothetical protein